MPTIDADAHVIESEETWKYMEGPEAEFKPKWVNTQNGKRTWLIDGREFPFWVWILLVFLGTVKQ